MTMLKTRENLLSEDQRKALDTEEKARKQKERKLIADLNETFATAAGMNSLRWIMEQSGMFNAPVVIDRQTWEVKDKAMLYNAGRVSIYLQIRKHLNPSITIPVENQGLAKDDDEKFDILS